MYQQFHHWLKSKDFHPNYPDADKVFDFAKDFPDLEIPSTNRNDPKTYNFCQKFYQRYESLRADFLKRDFWALCRKWRRDFGPSWRQSFEKGYQKGHAVWMPILMDLSAAEKDPEQYGYALGRNRSASARR